MHLAIFTLAVLALGLAGPVAAFDGALMTGQQSFIKARRNASSDDLTSDASATTINDLLLLDYSTASGYSGIIEPWSGCRPSSRCSVLFREVTVDGGYTFTAQLWQDDSGCYNIDFNKALGSQAGRCCSLPCNIQAPHV